VTKTNFNSRFAIKVVAGVALCALFLVPFIMFWGAPFATFIASSVKVAGVPLLLFSLFIGAGIWVFVIASRYDSYDRDRKQPTWKNFVLPIALIVVGLFGFLFAAFTFNTFRQLRYESDIVATAEPMPTFEQRAPFSQAKILLNRNKGGVQTGNWTVSPTFLGDGKWSIILDGDGTGLKANGVVIWDGKGEANENFTRCQFDGPTSALNGLLWNNLVRELRFVHGVGAFDFDIRDTYGYCDGDKAVIVAPITRYVGIAPAKRVFAGVAVVRSSDNIEFVENVEAGTIPGPVYPESLIMEVEAANGARTGSFGDIWFVRNDILVVDGEDGSPNSRNSGQFILTGTDGNLYAVSPMNRAKGSGSEIVAVAITPVSYANAGTVNPLTIHELPTPRQANSEIANLVQSEFSSLNWFAGLKVMEITPVGPNEWVGSIGRDVSPEHRFTVTPDRIICVTDVATGRLRGCSKGAAGGDGADSGPVDVVDPAPLPASDNLTGLSTRELIDLRNAVNAELDSRIPTPQP
jgi:hypothetical protein